MKLDMRLVLILVALVAVPAASEAVIHHFGVDVTGTNTYGTQGFYDGSGDGTVADLGVQFASFVFNTTGFPDANTITRFEIFFNGLFFEAGDRFTVEIFNATNALTDPNFGAFATVLSSVPFQSTGVPTNDAVFGDHTGSDGANGFYLAVPGTGFHDDIEANGLRVQVKRVANDSSGAASGDYLYGANLEIESTTVPEPATLLLLGAGLAAVGLGRARERRAR